MTRSARSRRPIAGPNWDSSEASARIYAPQDKVSIEMVRGAVFGLICCLYVEPSCMNVDRSDRYGLDFVYMIVFE